MEVAIWTAMVGRLTPTAPTTGGPSVDALWMRPWLCYDVQWEAPVRVLVT